MVDPRRSGRTACWAEASCRERGLHRGAALLFRPEFGFASFLSRATFRRHRRWRSASDMACFPIGGRPMPRPSFRYGQRWALPVTKLRAGRPRWEGQRRASLIIARMMGKRVGPPKLLAAKDLLPRSAVGTTRRPFFGGRRSLVGLAVRGENSRLLSRTLSRSGRGNSQTRYLWLKPLI